MFFICYAAVFVQEEATTFDPNWIASSFLHTYVVVQPVSGAPSSPCSVDSVGGPSVLKRLLLIFSYVSECNSLVHVHVCDSVDELSCCWSIFSLRLRSSVCFL